MDPKRTAIVIIDLLNNFRIERDGLIWDLMGGGVGENQEVPNIVRLIREAKIAGLHIFYSSRYDPDLILQFHEHDMDTVIMIGIDPELCMKPYLQAASEHGFGVILIEDALVEPGPAATQAAYESHGEMANQVVSAADMTARLKGLEDSD